MAEGECEMEKFLLDKLQAGIDRKVPYSNEFKKRKKSLENQLKSAKDEKEKIKIREKLYRLNNLMSKSNSTFDYLRWHLISGLYRIKKDISSASENGDAGGRGGDQHSANAAAGRSTRTMVKKEDLGLQADKLVVGNLVLYRRGGRFEDFNAVGIVGAEGVGKTTLARSIFAKEEVENEFLPRIWISLSEQPDDEDESVEIAIAKSILLALGVADETIGGIRQSAAEDAEIRPNTAAATKNQAAQPPASAKLLRKTSSIKSKFTRSSTRAKNQAAEEADRKAAAQKKAEEDSKRQKILGALVYAIRQELMGKRYLVVLDDASETQEWYRDLSWELTPERKPEEKLGFAFPKGSGGTVLVTGRSENVVNGMVGGDGIDIHRLLPLEDPGLCWKIYEATEGDDNGGIENGDDKEKEVKEEVVKRCNGLPAAAVLMGEIRKMVEEDKNQQTATAHPQPPGR